MTKTRLIADSANDNSIDGDRLTDGTVSDAKLGSGIDGNKLSDGSVPLSKLSGGEITVDASSVNYTPSGSTGTETTRSVQTKLREASFSVKDYGAVGDGVANDTVAINNAIQACSDAGGGVVIFPTATYKVRRRIAGSQVASIRLLPGVSLDFMGSTLLENDNARVLSTDPGPVVYSKPVTANVSQWSRQLTVSDTSDVSVGDEIFVRLVDNEWDTVEVKYSYWTNVVSIDSPTTITVDVPAPDDMFVALISSGSGAIVTSPTSQVDNSVTGGLAPSGGGSFPGGTTFSIVSAPANGSATVNPSTGAWTYTPNSNWNRSDTFNVEISTVGTVTVRVTGRRNRDLVKREWWLSNFFIKNLQIRQTPLPGGNISHGIGLSYNRNALVENVYAVDPGAGAVLIDYCDSCTIRNVWVPESQQQQGQASKGRVINMWNCYNLLLENIKGECFQGSAMFIESYCRNVVFKNTEWHNTWEYRKGTPRGSNHFFLIGQGSEVRFEDTSFYGKGSGQTIADHGGTSASIIFSGEFSLRVDGLVLGAVPTLNFSLDRFLDEANGADFYGTNVKRVVHTISYSNGWSDYNPGLVIPKGLILAGFYYINDKTNVGNITVRKSSGSSFVLSSASLVAGSRQRISPGGILNYGANYPFASKVGETASYRLYSTTVNPGTTITFEWVVMTPVDDGTDGRIQISV